MVSVEMRKMFAGVRKMFLNARDAEQDVRESAGEEELLSVIHVRMKLPDKREVGSSTLPRPINQNSLPRLWLLPLSGVSASGPKSCISRWQPRRFARRKLEANSRPETVSAPF